MRDLNGRYAGTQFIFQLSPVGIEVGGRLAAYGEGGFGVSSSLYRPDALSILTDGIFPSDRKGLHFR